MENTQYPINGSCQCGKITYELLEAPKMVVACHCKECQKLSTSAFSIVAIVDAQQVKFDGEMTEWSRVADSGNESVAKFCSTCGNRMYHFNPVDPDSLKLRPANLSDTSILNPVAHIWVSEKQDWYQIPEGVKVVDKQP